MIGLTIESEITQSESSAIVNHGHLSPLRYPGGKAKIANFIKLIFLQNRLIGSTYVEPYAGGCSVALSLLFEEYASHVHINDVNLGVYSFWHSVLNDTEALCHMIKEVVVSVDEWEKQKLINSTSNSPSLEMAFSTFFLNRTNISGIIEGGIIGGKNQEGKWKIDARFNKGDLIQRIKKFHATEIVLL